MTLAADAVIVEIFKTKLPFHRQRELLIATFNAVNEQEESERSKNSALMLLLAATALWIPWLNGALDGWFVALVYTFAHFSHAVYTIIKGRLFQLGPGARKLHEAAVNDELEIGVAPRIIVPRS